MDLPEHKFGEFASVEEFAQNVCKSVAHAVKLADGLETFRDLLDPEHFKEKAEAVSWRILQIIQLILEKQGLRFPIPSSGLVLDSVDGLFESFMSNVDQITEKIMGHIDEASGKNKDAPLLFILKTAHSQASEKKEENQAMMLASKSVKKPQDQFKVKVDNSTRPFVPLIHEKPNALLSLEESLKVDLSKSQELDKNFEYPHPYQYELDYFVPSDNLLTKVVPREPKNMDATELTYVDTEKQLDEVIEKLKKVTEIAVDLEHHSYRSFQGFTCLMQLSTREEDFIIDTLLLRHHMYKFNIVFTDPNIVKVLHGSNSDVVWLQKDFGLYLVNSFDTGQATRVLGFPEFSYAYLLKTYCQVTADKRYQLADWRIRPLPEGPLKYAREDTHYLLYIYDCLRNELLDRNHGDPKLLLTVIRNSTNLCKKKYQKPQLTETTYLDLYNKTSSKPILNVRQLEVLKRLCIWRDSVARMEDESIGYVLPNQRMLKIANNLPKDLAGLKVCCEPFPTTVNLQFEHILTIIEDVMKLTDDELSKLNAECLGGGSVVPSLPASNLVHQNVPVAVVSIDDSDDIVYHEDLAAEMKKVSLVMKQEKSSLISLFKLASKSSSKKSLVHQVEEKIVQQFAAFCPWYDSLNDPGAVWKMLPNTEEEVKVAKISSDLEVVNCKPVLTFEETNRVDELLKSVRNQIKSESAKQAADQDSQHSSSARQPKRKKKENEEDSEESGFRPHVYDRDELKKIFTGPSRRENESNNKKRRSDSRDDFNSSPRHKKPKAHQSFGGNKSYSFTPKNAPHRNAGPNGGPSSAPRIPWPGRK